jgi:hypothetical protein
MSSHATEGARPSVAPSGEPPTVEGASAAPVELGAAAVVSAGAAPAGASEDVAKTAESPAETEEGTAEKEEDTAETAEGTAATVESTAETADSTAETADAGAGAGTEEADAGPAPSDAARPDVEAASDSPTMVLDDEREPVPDRAEPVSKLAILALVTGLVALVPIAVAAGIGSLVGIRRTGRRGHGMAMAGLCLSAAWVICAAAVGTVGLVTHGFHKPVTVKYREAAVFKLQEGDCVNSPNAQLVSVLPCSTPHQAEVFATFSLSGSVWPGTSAVATEASSGCASRLNDYLNPQLTISLSQSYVFPDQVAWTSGTRTVVCEVRASSGDLTGSVRDSTLLRQTLRGWILGAALG